MAVIYSDAFTYADGHLDVLNTNWEKLTTQSFDIVSNVAKPLDNTTDCSNRWIGNSWPNDQYGQVTIAGGETTNDVESGVGIMLRAVDTSNYYRCVINGRAASNVSIAKRKANVYSLIASITQAFADGDVFKMQVVGNTLKAFRNGVQIGTDITGDSDFVSGNVGIFYSSTASLMSIDNFEGGSVEVVATDTRRYRIRRSRMTSW